MPTVRLDRLVERVDVFDRPPEIRTLDIAHVAESTDDVAPNSLFCCVPGEKTDGHTLAEVAIAKGAVALLVERQLQLNIPQVRVGSVRAALAPVAAAFYGHPSRSMTMVGVTGTNGKTTNVSLLGTIFREHGWSGAVLGTLSGYYTTPPAIKLQALLAGYRDKGLQVVAMEVSSLSLDQRRVDEIPFKVSIFTNLTQDHLDYHKSMDSYFGAKSMLFNANRTETGVINIDDPYGRRLAGRVSIPIIEFSLRDAEDLRVTGIGSTFGWKGEEITLPLLGGFNVSNALGAATAAHALGIPVATIASALEKVVSIPGRLEAVDRGQPFRVVVDFAHTPDGLSNVLQVARAIVEPDGGRVIVLFGCGGNRDAGKRPQMGKIGSELADVAIITNDNPRNEAPEAIAEQVKAGATREVTVLLDRAAAISEAVAQAAPGDIVVIAGKGHETYQETHGNRVDFDDRLVAAAALEQQLRGNPL